MFEDLRRSGFKASTPEFHSYFFSRALHFDGQPDEVDEAKGIFLVVTRAHGEAGDIQNLKRVRALAAHGFDVAFVETQSDIAGDGFRHFGEEGVERFAQRGKPETVVDHFGVVERELLFEVKSGAVEGEGFEFAPGSHEDRAAGGFITAARLHADKTIFNQIDAADAVFAA